MKDLLNGNKGVRGRNSGCESQESGKWQSEEAGIRKRALMYLNNCIGRNIQILNTPLLNQVC